MDTRDSLLTDLYGSVLEPETFLPTLIRINRWLDCDGVHVVGWDKAVGDMLVSIVVGEHLQNAEGLYKAHYQSIDPRAAMAQAQKPGVFIACQDYFDQKYVDRSEFYQDFLIPHGPRYVMGGNIFHDQSRDILVAFNHLVGRPKFSKEKRDRASALLPHFMKWTEMMMRAGALRAALSTGSQALQTLDQGVIALDQRMRITYANAVAQSTLGPGLMTAGMGLLAKDGPNCEQRLRRVDISRASETFAAVQTRLGKSTRYLVSVLAVAREGAANHTLPVGMQGMSTVKPSVSVGEGLFAGLSRPNLIVLVCRSDGGNPLDSQHLRQLFGLSPAEAKLAEALASGLSTRGYVHQNKVSITTIRTQIRALLAKTGAANLRELVGMLAGLPKIPTTSE